MPKLSFLILYTQACISTGSLTKQNTLWLIVPAEDGNMAFRINFDENYQFANLISL